MEPGDEDEEEADVDEDDKDEDEDEDEEGNGEKEREVLGVATLQNSWARLSADARSPIHCLETQLLMSRAKRVALRDLLEPTYTGERPKATHLPQKQFTSATLLQPTWEIERSRQFDTSHK